MCGFVGTINYHSDNIHQEILFALDAINYRGPDARGLWEKNYENFSLTLAHNRLSIIDLTDSANQPFHWKHLHIIFNGEIYNYREIRGELEKRGHTFVTHSDTEVILHAFHEYGTDFVHHLIGMFSIVIWDDTEQKLFLFRDRLGVKPLYYFLNYQFIAFASELKSLLKLSKIPKVICPYALVEFFSYGFINAPNSIIEGVKKLPPGHFIVFDAVKREWTEKKYWNPLEFYQNDKLDLNFQETKSYLISLLKNSFNYRMVADVPVGIFLSGGYDSSLLLALLKQDHENLQSFTIGFEDAEYNELDYAKSIANHLGVTNQHEICTLEQAKELLPTVFKLFDEPFADVSSIPTLLLSQFASRYVKVVLSADAADEFFCGYDLYRRLLKYYRWLNPPSKIPLPSLPFNLLNTLYGKKDVRLAHNLRGVEKFLLTKNFTWLYRTLSQKHNEKFLYKFLGLGYGGLVDTFSNIQVTHKLDLPMYLDTISYLPGDIFTKVDRATMHYSIEGREPFADHRIFEFAAQLPLEYKFNKGQGKVILKSITHDFIPQELLNRPKQGFVLPLYKWLRTDLKDWTFACLTDANLHEFNKKNIHFAIDQFFKGNKDFDDLIWQLILYVQWKQNYLS